MYPKVAALPKCESGVENFENSPISRGRIEFQFPAALTATASSAHKTADNLPKNTSTTWSFTTALNFTLYVLLISLGYCWFYLSYNGGTSILLTARHVSQTDE